MNKAWPRVLKGGSNYFDQWAYHVDGVADYKSNVIVRVSPVNEPPEFKVDKVTSHSRPMKILRFTLI